MAPIIAQKSKKMAPFDSYWILMNLFYAGHLFHPYMTARCGKWMIDQVDCGVLGDRMKPESQENECK